MRIVILTALGVGGATVLGSILGFIFKNMSARCADMLLALGGGIMFSSAMFSLLYPAFLGASGYEMLLTPIGLILGALIIDGAGGLSRRAVRSMGSYTGELLRKREKAMLLLFAMGIHNLPEGLAAGVGFAGGDLQNALSIAVGIAVQNIPEGMVIISPMLASGISKGRTLLYALLTGLIEVVGTVAGYFLSSLIVPQGFSGTSPALRLIFSVAAGTMLFITVDEIIPETHSRAATYAFIIGTIYTAIM